MILPEIVAVGIYNSDIAAKNTDVSKKRGTSMFEIELPIEEGGISYIDSGSRQISPDMIICAKPGQVRRTKFPFKCYYVHMIIHSGKLYDVLINTPDVFETRKRETYKNIFERLIKQYSTFADNDIILQSLILELIHTVYMDSGRVIKNSIGTTGNVIEKALIFIKEHLTEELTLETVADHVSLSPNYFHNIFKTAVSVTLREYIEQQRIKKAINLLLTTDFSLTEIAYECGFSSQSYFSYVFKRRMKTTPREYIKEIYNKYYI